ncbi:MAG: DUF533 domain-containing protein [Gemmatimonadota bacterium]
MTDLEREYIALTCVAAACADGHLDWHERQRIEHLVEDLGFGGRDLFREAFAKPVNPTLIAEQLQSADARRLAYQMAAQVCLVDGFLSESEADFLQELQRALGITEAAASGIRLEAQLYTDPGLPPMASVAAPDGGDLDQRILRFAMLAGAAELLPQSAAAIVVLPVQLKLVYQIGHRHGVQLDRGQVMELVAAFGIGATSQAVEAIARRLLGGVAKGVGGGLLGGLFGGAVSSATGAIMAFATTYAIGHSAEVYYRQGRKLDSGDLRKLFARFQEEAKTMYPRVEGEIRTMAAGLDAEALLQKVKSLA